MKPVNPYESPGLYPWPSDSKRGNTRIRVFAIALSLQGILELVLSLAFVFQWRPSILAVGIVALVASVGLLKIVAGFSVFRSGGMALGVLALATTVVSIASVFCLPTGIAVLVLGLLVFLDPKSRALLKSMSDSREHSDSEPDPRQSYPAFFEAVKGDLDAPGMEEYDDYQPPQEKT